MASCRKERVRCAIYIRKSSDEGLEQGVQFAAGAARGPRAKDTKVGCACLKVITIAGFSGATMDRSRLRRLLADIAQTQREACEAFIASQRHEGWILPACRL